MSAADARDAKRAWLASGEEEPLAPGLPICDPHHHLWDRPGSRYLLDELLADTAAHRIEKTVFVECGSMYRAEGAEALRPVGETEFVQGIAAQSASGGYGATRASAGIVGHANLLLGEPVRDVLEAHLADRRAHGPRARVRGDDDRARSRGRAARHRAL